MIRNGHTVLLGRGRFLSPSAKYMVLLKTSHDNNELSISNCYNLRTYETYGTTVRWYLSINFSPGISQVWIDVFWICSLLHIEVVETIWRDSLNHCYDLLVQSSAFVEPRRFQQKSHDGDGFQARTKTTKTSYEPNNDSYEKCGVQALPFLSFLCSTVFINMIQFYSIPGPYKIPRCLWPLCGGYGWKQTTVQQKAPIISSLWWFPMHPRSTLSPTLNRGPRCWQFAEEKYTLLNRLLQIP